MKFIDLEEWWHTIRSRPLMTTLILLGAVPIIVLSKGFFERSGQLASESVFTTAPKPEIIQNANVEKKENGEITRASLKSYDLAAINPESYGTSPSPNFELLAHYYNEAALTEIYSPDPIERTKIEQECLGLREDRPQFAIPLEKCKVESFSFLETIEGKVFFRAFYIYSELQKESVALVIFEGNSQSMKVKPVMAYMEISPVPGIGAFSDPHIRQFGKDSILRVPIWAGGNGTSNKDMYFYWSKASWKEINLVKWEDELEKRLPKGLRLWFNPTIDFDGLTFSSDLWREGDSHAGPTGGWVQVQLELKKGTFEIKTFQYSKEGALERGREE